MKLGSYVRNSFANTPKYGAKIIAISFIDLLAIGLTFPLLYPHLSTLGASRTVVGVFGSTYSGLQVLSGPVVGSWSDIRGRKFVATSTLLISCVCYLLIGLSSSLVFIFFLRIALGFVKHTQTLCKAVITDLIPEEQHSKIYGQVAAISSLGFVIGPIVGGHLSELHNGFFYVCCLTSLLFIINTGLFLSFPNTLDQQTPNGRQQHVTIRSLSSELVLAVKDLTQIDWKIYWDAFALRFLFGFSVSIYFSNQAFYIKEKFNLSQKVIGYMISFLSIVGSAAGLLLGIIKEKFYKNDTTCAKRLLHAFLTICVTFMGLYIAPNFPVFLALLVPFGVSNTILRIVSMELIFNRSHNKDRGSLSGASNSVMSVARLFSPITSGIVGDWFGENAVIFSAFVPSLLGTVLCMRLRYKSNVMNVKKD